MRNWSYNTVFWSAVIIVSKNGAYRDSNSNCLSRVRRFAGLSIPGRDTDCMSCSVFICALRSLYSALKSITLHYWIAIMCKFTSMLAIILPYTDYRYSIHEKYEYTRTSRWLFYTTVSITLLYLHLLIMKLWPSLKWIDCTVSVKNQI